MRTKIATVLVGLMLSASLTGCAQYEFDVIKPPLAPGEQRIGTKDDVVFEIEPIRYRMRTVENRLVIRAFNPNAEPVELVGSQSAVVDPTGQSRPVKGQVLPPGAFVKLILPPMPPEYVSDDGVRVGGMGGAGYGPAVGRAEFGLGGYDQAAEYTLRDGGQVYWDWDGETEVRVVLVFKMGEKTFNHELQFGKRKVK